ncbi:hypothetical protein C8F04DRAFT_948928, partial [Mycena alexandri]
HPYWYVRGVLYLVALLHTRYHVTFEACRLILKCVSFIFAVLPGNLLANAPMPVTLTTVLARLKIKDRFTVYPVCYSCHKVFPPSLPHDTFCPKCNVELFKPANRQLFEAVDPSESLPSDSDPAELPSATREPHLVSAVQVLSVALEDFFARPGMVSAVSAWKDQTQVDGELRSMQDAAVWKTMKGHNGNLFFFDHTADNEIRLGVTFSLDCYRAENLILTGMLPGATEQTAEQLQNYLKLVVDDLVHLYEQGIVVKAPGHPNGQ